MRMGQGVRTGLGHGGITCVLWTQFSSFLECRISYCSNCAEVQGGVSSLVHAISHCLGQQCFVYVICFSIFISAGTGTLSGQGSFSKWLWICLFFYFVFFRVQYSLNLIL